VEIDKIPFTVFKILETMRRTYSSTDNRIPIYDKDSFSKELIAFDMLELVEVCENVGYDMYKVTESFNKLSNEEVLQLVTGYTISDILEKKVISILDIPWNYEELFEELDECDGYFDKVDMDSDIFKNALEFHGFTESVGANGYYSVGTGKLSLFIENEKADKVIEILTGKTKEENDKIVEDDLKTKDIAQMRAIALKYGFNILTDKQINALM